MSFNVWIFAFNELCDLKKLKKLISGSCPTLIIQSYINYLKYMYIWACYTQNALRWFAYFCCCFISQYTIIYYFLKVTTSGFSIILYTCFSVPYFLHYFQKLKNQRYPFEEDASMCGLWIFKKFLDVYFLPCGFFFELLQSCC